MKDCAEFAVACYQPSRCAWRVVITCSAKEHGSNEAAKAEAERWARVYNAGPLTDSDAFKVLNLALYKLDGTGAYAWDLNNFKA